ncbi:MAG: hypothetical protein J5780_01870 [Treponema sp.]|nr:hypothetical protein [Treponema sp.]
MKILGFKRIEKKDSYLYYIKKYSAIAVIEVFTQRLNLPVSFSIEINSLGLKIVDLEPLPKTLDYPVLPITKSLKDYIGRLDAENKLP